MLNYVLILIYCMIETLEEILDSFLKKNHQHFIIADLFCWFQQQQILIFCVIETSEGIPDNFCQSQTSLHVPKVSFKHIDFEEPQPRKMIWIYWLMKMGWCFWHLKLMIIKSWSKLMAPAQNQWIGGSGEVFGCGCRAIKGCSDCPIFA